MDNNKKKGLTKRKGELKKLNKNLTYNVNNKIYLLIILLLRKCKSFVTCINMICYH